MRIRLLPILIFFAFALVVAKVFDLALLKGINTDQKHNNIQAIAKEDSKKEEKKEESAKDSTPTQPTDNKEEAKGSSDKKEENTSGGEGDESKPGPAQKDPPKKIDISDQEPMEKTLLENLAKRRKELDDWANSISMKENVLNATEKKINSKMEELKKLQDEVSSLLEQYKAKEDEKNKRLVRIYENMKPQEAAKIFDQMDINILIDIMSGMKEDASAKIISKMETAKAKDLTIKLAQNKKLGKVN